jgi:hypothetical protein
MRTQLEAAAVRLAVQSSHDLSEIVGIHPRAGRETAMAWVFSPDISILTGDADAFNGVVAKLTGNIYPYLRLADGGLHVDRNQNFLLILPVSAGFETDRRFARVSGLLEMGTVAFWKRDLVKNLNLIPAVYLQTGYKFSGASGTPATGGAKDESSEPKDQALFRIKGTFGMDWKIIKKWNEGDVALHGRATGWLDAVNSKQYYRLEGRLGIPLGDKQTFDLTYEKGSGEPNFNTGDQFSANLTVQF